MIQILPLQDQQREELLLKTHEVKGNKVLVMDENGSELGWVSLKIDGETLVIIKFELTGGFDINNLDMEQVFFLDSLMRSAASYGEVHGAVDIKTADNAYNAFLAKKKFLTDEQGAFILMSEIVKYS